MTKPILDVLMHIMQHHVSDGRLSVHDERKMVSDLGHAGFCRSSIVLSIQWLQSLAQKNRSFVQLPSQGMIRVFSSREMAVLGRSGYHCLYRLAVEQGITACQQELVIYLLMSLGLDRVSEDIIEWVVMMVVANLAADKGEH